MLFFNDPALPTLASGVMLDGRQVTLLGTKDAQGRPTSITSLVTSSTSNAGSPAVTVTVTYDNQGRPAAAVLGTGEMLTFLYKTPTQIDLIFTLLDGSTQGPFHYNPVSRSLTTSAALTSPLAASLLPSRSRSLNLAAPATSGGTILPTKTISGGVSVKCGGVLLGGASVAGTYTSTSLSASVRQPIHVALPIDAQGGPGSFQYRYPANPFSTLLSNTELPVVVQQFADDLARLTELPCASKESLGIVNGGFSAISEAILPFCPLCAGMVLAAIPTIDIICALQETFDRKDLVDTVLTLLEDLTKGGTIHLTASYMGQTAIPKDVSVDGSEPIGPDIELVFSLGQCVTLTFDPSSYLANSAGPAPMTVVRKGFQLAINATSASVVYSDSCGVSGVACGTAVRGQDYQLTGSGPQTLMFNPGEISKSIPIQVLDNPARVMPKTVKLALSFPEGASVVAPVEAVLTIPSATFRLTITKDINGTGTGSVTSTPTGINCGGTCFASFASDTPVILTATPVADSFFNGWSGDCEDSNATTRVFMNGDRSCIARFDLTLNPPPYPGVTIDSVTCTTLTHSPPFIYQVQARGHVSAPVGAGVLFGVPDGAPPFGGPTVDPTIVSAVNFDPGTWTALNPLPTEYHDGGVQGIEQCCSVTVAASSRSATAPQTTAWTLGFSSSCNNCFLSGWYVTIYQPLVPGQTQALNTSAIAGGAGGAIPCSFP